MPCSIAMAIEEIPSETETWSLSIEVAAKVAFAAAIVRGLCSYQNYFVAGMGLNFEGQNSRDLTGDSSSTGLSRPSIEVTRCPMCQLTQGAQIRRD
jgi:hypothetical protein